jgi:thioredoxin 1
MAFPVDHRHVALPALPPLAVLAAIRDCFSALFLSLFLMTVIPASAASRPYDEQADARADVEDAMRMARKSGKNMLVVYGANWCADCLRLDSRIHDNSELLGDQRFVIVKVDVGRFDKNIDLARMHGNPISKGIPGAAVVSPEGKTLYAGPLINLLEPYTLAKKLLRYTGGTLGILLAAAIMLVVLRRARLAGQSAQPAHRAGAAR